mmetsp:Transcript_12088/g.51920  ORF Transcript_12088/g.51920 Transcript_12088/m.51920 type:complete len:332 (+) Transcript_12088:1798-2793(+)
MFPSSMNSCTADLASAMQALFALMSALSVSVIAFWSSLARSSYAFSFCGTDAGCVMAFQYVSTTSSSKFTPERSSASAIAAEVASVARSDSVSRAASAAKRRKSSSASGVSTSDARRSVMARNRPYASAFRAWNCSTSFATSASRRSVATPTSARLISTQSTPIRRNGSKLSLVDSTASTSSARRRISASVSARVISFGSSSSVSSGGAEPPAGSGSGSGSGGCVETDGSDGSGPDAPGVSSGPGPGPAGPESAADSSRLAIRFSAAASALSTESTFGAGFSGFSMSSSNAAKRSASALGPGKFSSSTSAIAARAATTNGSSRAGVGTMRF